MSKWAYRDMPRPHAFIQWKGTEVCMDCYCVCGKQMHIDAEFAYAVRCHHCGRRYEMSAMIEMREMPESEVWDGCEIKHELYSEPVGIATNVCYAPTETDFPVQGFTGEPQVRESTFVPAEDMDSFIADAKEPKVDFLIGEPTNLEPFRPSPYSCEIKYEPEGADVRNARSVTITREVSLEEAQRIKDRYAASTAKYMNVRIRRDELPLTNGTVLYWDGNPNDATVTSMVPVGCAFAGIWIDQEMVREIVESGILGGSDETYEAVLMLVKGPAR